MPTAPIRASGYNGSTLNIDTATGTVVGDWLPIPGEAVDGLDFVTPAELCRCCGRVLLISGSKFSIWFCNECSRRVRELNAAAARCVIPVGRHTFCNGIGLKPAREWQTDDLERFVDDTRSLWDSMELLERWAREIVRRQCAALGLDAQPTAGLALYLDGIHDHGIGKREAFAQMLDGWAEQ